MSLFETVLIGWTAAAVLMAAIWLWQLRTHNAGIVDVVWSVATALLAGWFAYSADGLVERRWLIAALAIIWGARLGSHLADRMGRESEDGRYRQMREQWGDKTQRYLFVFFQVQAFWSVLFAVPMLLAARNPAPLGWLDGLGTLIWAAAVLGEAIADRQLARFKQDPANRGKVCQTGLWRYSRHPNYFFEWLHWWAYVPIGWLGPYGWLTLGGPAVMLLFLTKVTGIPPTEKNALRSRGEAYRAYQRTTSVFIPWPPKETPV